MLISKTAKMNWHPMNKKWYEDRGYIFTKFKDEFQVNVEDLPPNSMSYVITICDYCFKENPKQYLKFLKGREKIEKDCCSNPECQHKKMSEICMKEHGVSHNSKRPEIISKISNAQKISYEEVVQKFKNKGYLLTTTYDEYNNIITSKDYLKFICLKHEEYGIQFALLEYINSNKCNCKKCNNEYISERQKTIDIKNIFDDFKNRGYDLISTEYIDAHNLLEYMCENHKEIGIQKISWNHFNSGKGCPYCAIERNSKDGHWNWQGGISELNNHLRLLLKGEWKKQSLEKNNYRCDITDIHSALEIHHEYSFNLIVEHILNELNLEEKKYLKEYTIDEINLIDEKFIEFSFNNLGTPLLPEIHSLFHSIYGRGNNIPEQYKEFKEKIYNKEISF